MSRRTCLPALVVAAALATPAVATAEPAPDGATPPPEPAATTPEERGDDPGAVRGRAGGRIGVRFEAGVHRVGATTLTVPGRTVRVGGRVVPHAQQVTLRIWSGRRLVRTMTVRPRPSQTGRTATYRARFRVRDTGRLRVFAVRPATATQRRLVSRPATLTVAAPTPSFGARGPYVALLQRQLARLGYAVPRSGVYDAGTGRAIEAFRKVNGMARVQTLDRAVVDRLLRGVGGFKVRYPGHGRHVEANLTQQVLALIEGGRVVRAYTTSSGAPATPTVLGSYRFYWKQPGVNNKQMVHSAYFIRGYAIHGYASVPTHPASAGCLRVPIPNAREIFDWIRIGDRIDVYY